MDFIQTSHCSWDCGEMRIIKEYCPRRGGVSYKLWDGRQVTYHPTLEQALKAAEAAYVV